MYARGRASVRVRALTKKCQNRLALGRGGGYSLGMETTTTVCGKCAGSGLYIWRSGERDVCYPCEGTGRVEAKPTKVRALRPVDARLRLRGWYRNAQLPTDHPCHLAFAVILDQSNDGMGWTQAGLDAALDAVPGSREAFRAIGWPV